MAVGFDILPMNIYSSKTTKTYAAQQAGGIPSLGIHKSWMFINNTLVDVWLPMSSGLVAPGGEMFPPCFLHLVDKES